jgi:hypothetical protein
VSVPPAQAVPLPLTGSGAAGAALTDTASREAGEVSQPFTAATVTTPPDGPAVTVTEFVVEVPVQPSGSVHS